METKKLQFLDICFSTLSSHISKRSLSNVIGFGTKPIEHSSHQLLDPHVIPEVKGERIVEKK